MEPLVIAVRIGHAHCDVGDCDIGERACAAIVPVAAHCARRFFYIKNRIHSMAPTLGPNVARIVGQFSSGKRCGGRFGNNKG
jgi:hypothetical protein